MRAARGALAPPGASWPNIHATRQCGGIVGLMLEKSASISSSGEFEYLLRSSFSSNELTLCSLWWAGFMRTWSLPRPPQQHPSQGPALTGGEE